MKTQRFYWAAVAVFATLAAGLFYLRPPILASLRALAFDTYQRAAPAAPLPQSPVIVVHIDEDSLARVGQWPWSRTTMAELTQRLGEAGAAVVAFDVLFAEADRTSPEQVLAGLPRARRNAVLAALGRGAQSNDATFADALATYPSVLAVTLHHEANDATYPSRAGVAAAGDDPNLFLTQLPGVSSNLAILNDAAAGAGFINWLPDRDQVVRRVPLLLSHDGEVAPSLSLEALRVAFQASTYIVRSSNANGAQSFGAHTGIESIKLGPLEIPTDAEGQIWVRFRPYDRDEAIPAWRVLAGEFEPSQMSGAIVLVGASAPGLMDLRATPLDAAIPGVEIHRQVLEQIAAGTFLTRPDYAPGVELIVTLIVIFLLALAAPRLRPEINAAIGVVIVVALWGAGFLLFRAGFLFDPVFPTLAAFVFSAAATTYFYRQTERQRVEIRRAFSQYVAPSVVRELVAHPERLKLGGEVRELTVFVCDIRNFSSIAERMSAEELTAFINSFLTPLSDIIIDNGGTIDKYMGDAILAFWNAPLDQPDHGDRACRAAFAILTRMDELNDGWRKEAEAAGRPFETVRIGIGLNSGEACVGNLGSQKRFDYSAIGDSVNIAARLEGLCKIYGVALLASEETTRLAPQGSFLEAGLVRLKGRAGATRVFTSSSPEHDVSTHVAFLEAFQNKRLAEADGLLAKIEAQAPPHLHKLYGHYRGRIDHALQTPQGPFDPVYDPDQK